MRLSVFNNSIRIKPKVQEADHMHPEKLMFDTHKMTEAAIKVVIFTPTRILISACLAIASFTMAGALLAKYMRVPALTVGLPHGGCALAVWRDGKASLRFGAMPRWVRAKNGAFKFDELTRSLRRRSSLQDGNSIRSSAMGSVKLPGRDDIQFIQGDKLVRGLLERAWHARTAPSTPSEEEDHGWIFNACAFRHENPKSAY
jgi:hypothetical protein